MVGVVGGVQCSVVRCGAAISFAVCCCTVLRLLLNLDGGGAPVQFQPLAASIF